MSIFKQFYNSILFVCMYVCVYMCVYALLFMDACMKIATFDLDGQELNSSIKDVNYWTINKNDLFILMNFGG